MDRTYLAIFQLLMTELFRFEFTIRDNNRKFVETNPVDDQLAFLDERTIQFEQEIKEARAARNISEKRSA